MGMQMQLERINSKLWKRSKARLFVWCRGREASRPYNN